eukprot:jgi/Ulvmu1/4148/UM019_0127.1
MLAVARSAVGQFGHLATHIVFAIEHTSFCCAASADILLHRSVSLVTGQASGVSSSCTAGEHLLFSTMATAEPPEKASKAASPAREEFLGVYKTIRDEILEDPMITQADAKAWMARMMDYNVPGGKLNRGMSVKDTLLSIDGNASGELRFQADCLGWAIEFLQAYFLVADDIMDKSITRRGQPCWYRVDDVGMMAINDGILLEQIIYKILRTHVRNHPAYLSLLELFLETTHQTAHGQLLDLITAPVGKIDLEKFSLNRYMDIVTWKTAFYSFYLPVACGMYLAGERNQAAFDTAKSVLVKMGQYFQIQDDYLDCFADPELLGKVGTDIQDNKCSWLVCKALQEVTQAQKELILQNYGRDDPACILKIKQLYKELDLETKFKELEAASYAELTAEINAQSDVPTPVFNLFLGKIYKRTK